METRGRETVIERRETRAEPVVRTEPRVVVATVEKERVKERDEDRERRKAKGKTGLLTAAGVVLFATLLTMGTTWLFAGKATEGAWHFAGKAKEGVNAGIEGIENIASKGKETLLGKSTQSQFENLGRPGFMEKAKATLGFGRHEALQKLRDALGVESGTPISAEDYDRLEELIRLDQYSHSEGFWDNLKDKLGNQQEKLKSTLGKDKDKLAELVRNLGSHRLREILGLEDKPLGYDILEKLKEILGVEENKPIGEKALQKLKGALGYREPGFWDKAKSKLHMGSSEQPDILQQIRTAIGADKSTEPTKFEHLKEKVKDVTGLGKDHTEKLIEEAKHKVSESEELLQKAYAEHQREKGGR